MKSTTTSKRALLALAALMPCVQAAQIDVVASQTVTTTPYGANVHAITGNTTWTKDNVYILKDKVFVTNGATLTIEPGTKIYSTFDDKGTPGKDDDQFGSLVIVRGAKINAAGTAAEPIVFTTIDELEAETQTDLDGDTEIAEAPGVTTAGRWGGVVLLGNAPIANYNSTTNIGEDRIEGFQPAASADLDTDGRADVIEYGGTTANDNSGVFRYISIRHGGYVYATNPVASEINGLTLGGVGSGTTIDHVEVYANADDGIEFFGGTVNTSHVVLAFNQDDSFDIDQGYSGTNQFWFAIQAPFLADGVTSAHDNGGEWDGVTGTIADNAGNSAPIIWNATFIGSGVTAANGNDKGNNAILVDDRFKGQVYNSVFDDYKEKLIEGTSDGAGSGLTFSHNTVGRFGGGTPGNNLSYLDTATTAANTFFDGSGAAINGNSNGGTDPQFRSYSRDAGNALLAIDPRPAAGSPLLSGSLQPGAPSAAAFRGAFGADNWAAGWTKFDSAGFFKEKVDVVATQTVNNTAFGANVHAITTNTTWTKDKVYILTDKVFVTNGAMLTIEPGTKIYSTFDDKGTPGKDDDQFGSLVIVRGAKIHAAGTAEEPIVFTTIDELEAETVIDFDGDGFIAEAPGVTTAGRWGGLVLLGNAPIANYTGTTNIGEDRIEGFQPAASADLDTDGRADVIEYGGTTANDNSGVLQYVSIRHGGYVYATNPVASEINGLTLGGVGSGTTIDHVEVYANADDGIEFFGGTVNTSHIVLAFNQDDSFDIDQGYSGTNQFWFAIQNPFLADGVTSAHDNGGEWDGVTGTIADNASNSAPIIWNATFIGSGVTAANGNDKGNNAILVDDRFKGQVYNSVFDDYKEKLIEATSDGAGSGLTFAHNTIGRFGGGAYTGSNASNLSYLDTATTAANTFFDTTGSPINGNSNGGVNPHFRSYVRDAGNALIEIDPRPASGSPLLSGSLQSGAPSAAAFRGAFGADNWAAGWTKMSEIGFLKGEVPATGGGEPPFADVDGDGISDTLEASPDLQALGFTVGVNDAARFASIYTEDSILDLVTGTQVMVQKSGANVTLSVPLFRSTDLSTFTPAPALDATFEGEAGKEFYRIQVGGAE
ncbi:hypothetical protein [Luteolibacter luteus]|uniref:FG-GAP repeat protein n=1 Tax=Luteolibacter luteus TaxID=2728835 RepID=A0A858REX9_9BACT|nr:hypothetical protein [Luteolibacter luteus]QJE95397.1 hypothetical protein HHL09_06250 [Luteolibacter luteus]